MNHVPKLFAAFLRVTATIAVALAVCPTALAQITITSATFPVAGDTLKMAIDNSPAAGVVTITPPGGNQTWNFSGLQVDATRDIIFRPASEGSVQVPGAELFALSSPNWEEYYNVTSNSFELQADYGIRYDVVGNSLFNYRPPVIERRAPVNYFDINQISPEGVASFPPGAFPPALIAALIAAVTFPIDSLRYRTVISRLDVVDAWGSLSIPGGTYNVLREKRTRYQQILLDGKDPVLGWRDVTVLALQVGFCCVRRFDTLITYNFWNDMAKEPIAVVNTGSNGLVVQSVTYKYNNITSVPEQTPLEFALLQNYPNPFNPSTRIPFSISRSGVVSLKVYDILGRELQTLVNEQLNPGSYEATFDGARLASGVYYYRLEANGFVQTKKLVLLR